MNWMEDFNQILAVLSKRGCISKFSLSHHSEIPLRIGSGVCE